MLQAQKFFANSYDLQDKWNANTPQLRNEFFSWLHWTSPVQKNLQYKIYFLPDIGVSHFVTSFIHVIQKWVP
jgi:hypothetical protein